MAELPKQEQLKEYADKWLKGTITPQEKELFEKWYNELPTGTVYWPGDESGEQVREKIFNELDNFIKEDRQNTLPQKNKKRIAWRIAAAVAAFFLLGIAIIKWSDRNREKIVAEIKPAPGKSILDKTTDYTRHLTLPDGSKVILRANSKLDYSGNFSGNSREVILVGEAYFDIVHDEKKPFIIHTGAVKTTVLGTAFNINAYPNSKNITVAVTRGKVKVEKNQQLLAVLMPNQQVTYNPSEPDVTQQSVDAATIVTEWTKQEMAFEDMSFKKVGQLLSRRYNVNINFKNPALQQCTIKAFFNGTESLEKVLEVLCIISNASYTMTDMNNVLLDGQGCVE